MARTRRVLLTLALAAGCAPSAADRSAVHAGDSTSGQSRARPADSVEVALCSGVKNSTECEKTVQRSAFVSDDPRVADAGGRLRITLDSGDSVVFTDAEPDAPEGAWFTYRGLLRRAGYHVVEVRFYEGGEFRLVNARTGEETRSNGLPVVSPDAQRIAAGNADLEARYTPTTLQIWRVRGDRLETEWVRDFVEAPVSPDSVWGPGEVAWLSPAELIVARDYGPQGRRGTARVRLEGGAWTVVPQGRLMTAGARDGDRSLVGLWQRDLGEIASGLGDVYRFWPDGRFSFAFSEMDCAKREESFAGRWELAGHRLTLRIDERRTLVGGRFVDATGGCASERELVGGTRRTVRLRQPEVLTLEVGDVEDVRTDLRGAVTPDGERMRRVAIGGHQYWQLAKNPDARGREAAPADGGRMRSTGEDAR